MRNIYIYIYIYVCVCVCVCVNLNRTWCIIRALKVHTQQLAGKVKLLGLRSVKAQLPPQDVDCKQS